MLKRISKSAVVIQFGGLYILQIVLSVFSVFSSVPPPPSAICCAGPPLVLFFFSTWTFCLATESGMVSKDVLATSLKLSKLLFKSNS